MATCAIIGQAVGTAAAIAVKEGLSPRGVYEKRIGDLQEALMEDDCYLPWHAREVPALTREAKLGSLEGDPEALRNGHDRPVGGADNGWRAPLGSCAGYVWDTPQRISQVRLVFDSDLDRVSRKGDRDGWVNMRACYTLHDPHLALPGTMIRAFRIEALDANGAWQVIARVDNNRQRLVRLNVAVETRALRLVPEASWGAAEAHVFSWDVR
jgi:hypothetical protein